MLIWSEPADWETCARDGGIAIDDMGAVRLAASHLITHEPGAFSTQHGEELFQHVQAQVCFTLGQTLPQWADCYFFAREDQDNRWPLLVAVNGLTQSVGPGTPLAGEFVWYHVRIPQEALLPGQNVISFACESPAAQAWILAVDTSVPNEHSRKSTDGGRSWSATGLGLEGALCGEYVVRLRVREHPALGVLTSPIINLETLAHFAKTFSAVSDLPQRNDPTTTGEGDPFHAFTPLRIQWEAVTPPETSVVLRYRSGSLPALEDEAWNVVTEATYLTSKKMDSRENGNDGLARAEVPFAVGPYFQWQVMIATNDGCATPTLRSVVLGSNSTSANEPQHACMLLDTESRTAPSYAFTHQDPAEPKLAVLREAGAA